ncbi:MAG TPA: response regulator transcription factor [Chloroflexia bacterium]|nr:response regulator transcription factor [Chloroflexia bacterium]
MKVLLIDDDAKQLKAVTTALEREGFAVEKAATGEEGLFKAEINNYRVIILDLGLPDLDGLEIARQLRQQGSNAFILMLTAKDAEEEKIIGFLAGADDYVTKPFSLAELVMRVKVGLRRVENTTYPPNEKLVYKGLSLDEVKHQAWLNGQALKLSPKEFSLLEYFMRNPGRPIPQQELFENVWGDEADASLFSQTVKVHVSSLRRKLAEFSEAGATLITTVPQVGYKL